MGARGLHQRLRHRQHGEGAAPARAQRCRASSGYREESEYFLSRATDYVNMFDPAIGFFQGRAASGRWKSSPERLRPARLGPRARLHRDRRLELRVPRAAGRPGPREPLRRPQAALGAKLDAFFATPETATFTGSYGGTIHEMLEARDVRMGQWGFSNQVSHHIPYMYDYAGAAVRRRRRRCARRCGGCTPAARSARATRATRTTARRRPGTCSARSASTRCRWGARTTRSARRCSRRRRSTGPAGATSWSGRRNNSTRNVYVQGLRINGRRWNKTLPAALDARPRRRR